MLKYKIDVLECLKNKGFSTYRIRKEKLLSQGSMTRIRQGLIVDTDTLDKLCTMLSCDISDIIFYQPDKDI